MDNRSIVMAILISIVASGAAMAQDKLYPDQFPLGDVTLLDGPFKKAQDLNTAVLLKYTVGRLLFCYRKDAGLSTQGLLDYENWNGLSGHMAGHYLSALAMNYAATGNTQCKLRMDTMVTELKKCQDANGSDPDFVGYVSGIPGGKAIWRSIKGGNPGAIGGGWAPWYNVHKTYAGLRDAWVYGGSETAKAMFLKLCDWGINLCAGLTDAQMQQMLGANEPGGINEMYADAYQMTSDAKYLTFAKRMAHKQLLDAMAAGNDILDGMHGNTRIAKVVGFQRTGEVGKDSYYYNAANFFLTTVSTKRSIAIGGNTQSEYFPAPANCLKFLTDMDGVETCNSYNMLKLTEGLFRQKPDAMYTDYYERVLFNQILSSQNSTHGGYVYFSSTHPRHYRVYSAPDVAMWCDVGTGMENHTKYGKFIYTHTSANDSLFVNLFIASQLNWKTKGVTIKQETLFPDEEQTKLTVSVTTPTAFKMYIRHPYWAATGEMKVMVGSETFGLQSQPTSYVEVNRTWNDGDVVTVLLPMHFSYEQLMNVPGWYALKRGPIVLAAKTDSTISNMPGLVADAGSMGQHPSGTLLDYNTAPKLSLNTYGFDSQFKPVAGQPLTYRAPGIFQNKADTNLVLRPFFRTHNVRYMMYWNAMLYTGVKDMKRQETPTSFGVSQSKGVMNFSFAATDRSRHVLLFTVAGKRIADVPAPFRTITLEYPKQGQRMKNGMYIIRILSRSNQISKAVFVTDGGF